MNLKVLENPTKELILKIDKKLEEYNLAHWEVKERFPLAVVLLDETNELRAGVSAHTFGYWLLIENIWVDEILRGKNIGSQLLNELEKAAMKRGCKFALLDTLNFQARPFYEKLGYEVKWTQENYPREGCKYFMVKDLKDSKESTSRVT